MNSHPSIRYVCDQCLERFEEDILEEVTRDVWFCEECLIARTYEARTDELSELPKPYRPLRLECDWENFPGDDSSIILTVADLPDLYECRVTGDVDPHGGHCFRSDDAALTVTPIGSLAQAEAILISLKKSKDFLGIEADGLLWPLSLTP